MIGITNTSCNTAFNVEVIRGAALATLKMYGSEACEVSVLLTDDAHMLALNRDYRGIAESTDVLAFAMREGEDGDVNPNILGDLVISLETAAQQAWAAQHSLEVEVAFLTVHGVLHLLGHDHQTPEEAAVMFEKQETILRRLQANIEKRAHAV